MVEINSAKTCQFDSFTVKGQLGHGSFGSVLELENCKSRECLAMKVIRPQKEFLKQGQHELRVLQMVQKYYPDEPTLLQYVSAFYSTSVAQNQTKMTQLCLLFPKYEMTLTHLIRGGKIKGLTMRSVSYIGEQLLHALNCLRKIGLHHRDIKPDNIMVKKPPVDDKIEICLIDFGSATTHVEPSSKPYVQSRFYRAPEVMLGHTYGMDVDMWSFGCVMVEMLFAKPIFLGQNETEQLKLINQFLGPFPRSTVEWGTSTLCSMFSRDYDIRTNEIMYKMITPPVEHYWGPNNTLKDVCLKEPSPRDDALNSSPQIRLAFYDFVLGCLRIDYSRRWTPEQAIGHPFLQLYKNKRILDDFVCYTPDFYPPHTVDRSSNFHRFSMPQLTPIYLDHHRYSPSCSYSSESDGSPYSTHEQYFPNYSPSLSRRNSPSSMPCRNQFSWASPSARHGTPQACSRRHYWEPKPRSYSQDHFNYYSHTRERGGFHPQAHEVASRHPQSYSHF